jgi:hypothetical protein
MGGMDIRKAIGSNDLTNCVYTYNLCPFEYGLRVRDGYREWQINVDAGAMLGVHTLIPFDSVAENDVGNKLFAVTNEGIWDVTEYDSTPVQVVIFADQSEDAGYGTFTHYVDQAEADVLFYADSLNGLYSYDAATELWVNTGILDNLDEADVKFVMSHKNNVWFAVRNSTIGYYLPILAKTGVVTPQYFGDKFQHGGSLEGMFSWSVDGGRGVDDIFVAVSHAGDVIVYTGSGPDESDWGMKGVYYIGDIPNTPRFGSEQGGELFLLSAYGLSSMNDLLQGVDSNSLQAGLESNGMAAKIGGQIRTDMKNKIDDRGWDVALVPTEGGVLVSTPTLGSAAPIQYYYNLTTQGWGIWRGVPMQCFTEFQDAVYFGTQDGRIMRMDVPVDDMKLTPDNPNFNGEDIEFSILTAFSALEAEGVYKRVKLIRPDFLASLKPLHSSQIRYDYDINEGELIDQQTPSGGTLGLWDVSNWDEAVWASAAGSTFPTIGGAWGYGRYVAVATKGASRARTRLIGWDLIYDIGGPMI